NRPRWGERLEFGGRDGLPATGAFNLGVPRPAGKAGRLAAATPMLPGLRDRRGSFQLRAAATAAAALRAFGCGAEGEWPNLPAGARAGQMRRAGNKCQDG